MRTNNMNERIFESILRERGSRKITSEMALLKALAAKKTVYARDTGPFGEDEGATVVAFGTVEELESMLKITPDVLDYTDCRNERDFMNKMGSELAIIISKKIAMNGENFYLLDEGRSLEECNLYV